MRHVFHQPPFARSIRTYWACVAVLGDVIPPSNRSPQPVSAKRRKGLSRTPPPLQPRLRRAIQRVDWLPPPTRRITPGLAAAESLRPPQKPQILTAHVHDLRRPVSASCGAGVLSRRAASAPRSITSCRDVCFQHAAQDRYPTAFPPTHSSSTRRADLNIENARATRDGSIRNKRHRLGWGRPLMQGIDVMGLGVGFGGAARYHMWSQLEGGREVGVVWWFCSSERRRRWEMWLQ